MSSITGISANLSGYAWSDNVVKDVMSEHQLAVPARRRRCRGTRPRKQDRPLLGPISGQTSKLISTICERPSPSSLVAHALLRIGRRRIPRRAPRLRQRDGAGESSQELGSQFHLLHAGELRHLVAVVDNTSCISSRCRTDRGGCGPALMSWPGWYRARLSGGSVLPLRIPKQQMSSATS